MTKGSKNNNSCQIIKNDSVSEDEMSHEEIEEHAPVKFVAMMNYQMLPLIIKKRVHALKNFQLETIKVEQEFYKELHNLEVKFQEQFQVIFNKRNDIVKGDREPSENEADFDSDCENDVDAVTEDFKNKAYITNGDQIEKGIPEFWLKALQHSHVGVNIQENDLNILKHLVDLKCVLKSGEENGFILEFYFSPNEYFTNDKLTKQYFMQINASESHPLGYDGPEIIKTKGCEIEWSRGKNVTVKMVKKVKKAKKGTPKQTLSVAVKTDSFFNFFDPPTQSLETDEELDSDIVNLLEADFELGDYLRESVIPRAVMYYTGEELEEDDSYDEDCEDDEDEDDSESNDDVKPTKKQIEGAQAPECKQQ